MDKICFVEYWILWNNRVQALMLKGLPCVHLNITNVYAPNNPLKITILWEQLKEKLPCNNKWIICGD
jgi:hypothetical protein